MKRTIQYFDIGLPSKLEDSLHYADEYLDLIQQRKDRNPSADGQKPVGWGKGICGVGAMYRQIGEEMKELREQVQEERHREAEEKS